MTPVSALAHGRADAILGPMQAEPIRALPTFDPNLVNAALCCLREGVIWLDANGIVVLINDAARALFGRAFVGGHISQCVDRYGVQRIDGTPMTLDELPLARALLRRERVVDEACRIRRPNGTLVPVLATATPLDDDHGRSVGAMLVVRESNGAPGSAYHGRAAEERRFEALASATAQVIWEADASGLVTKDSASWRAFTGQSSEEYAGYGWLNAVHEEDRARAREAWRDAVESRTSYEVEYRLCRHDGIYRWTMARGAPVLDREGRLAEWIGCNWDIHPIKDAERELGKVVEYQQMLLAIVGHDLRNPLSTILMGAAILQKDAVTTVRRTAERVTRAALRAQQITSLLLDLAEVKLGRGLPLVREHVDIAAIARDVVAEHEGSVPGRAISLALAGPTTAWVDPGRIGQILGNLVGNALHHGKPGTDIEVSVRGDGHAVDLIVENAGDDIPKEQRDGLFTPFAGSSAPPSKRRNLGLGLYIVKTIAEAHAGTVDVESSAGRIVFRVRLARGGPRP